MHARRFARALVHALGLVAIAPAPARAEPPLAIEDAVRMTLANNELALKAPLRVEAADGQLDRARAAFLPTLTIGGTGALKSTPDRNGKVFSTNGNLTLSLPL